MKLAKAKSINIFKKQKDIRKKALQKKTKQDCEVLQARVRRELQAKLRAIKADEEKGAGNVNEKTKAQ